MYTTKEFLKADPWEAVINQINELYLTELTTYTTKLKAITSLGGTRTEIVIEPNVGTSDYSSMPQVTRTTYEYDRLDLSTFFRTGSAVQQLTGFVLPTDTFKVLDGLSELNDIVFTLNDFMHIQYNDYNQTYVLKANPKSLRFIGEISFQFINTTKQLIPNLATYTEFPDAIGRPLGATDLDKIIGQYTTAGFDFTEHREYIKELTEKSGWPNTKRIVAILNDVTKYPWVGNINPTDWNVAYSMEQGQPKMNVVYNGIVLPRYTQRTDLQRVCVLRLGDLSTNVAGYLLLHYN